MTVQVNPDILRWAREATGLSVEDAASKVGLTDSSASSPGEKLAAMESGEKFPTRNQLADMARIYRRPLLTFYLAEAPRPGRRGTDFRQTNEGRDAKDEGLLNAVLRDIHFRQSMLRDILMDEDDFRPLPFVGSIKIEEGVSEGARVISSALQFDPNSPRRGDADALFKLLRNASEEIGVFVLLIGDLGNYRSTISSNVFRGLAIADDAAPMIVINAKDAKSSRPFTLVHELVHLFLGITGVSDAPSAQDPTTSNAIVERFCNDVAAEILLPRQHLLQEVTTPAPEDVESVLDLIERIATRWSVSEPLVAYQLLRLGHLSKATYADLRPIYAKRWSDKIARDKMGEKRSIDGRIIKQSYLGGALLRLVHRLVRGNALTHTKAGLLVGARPTAVEPLLRHFESNQGSFVTASRASE